MILGLIVVLLAWDLSVAKANPVQPLEVDRAAKLGTLSVFASPIGEQIIGYKQAPGDVSQPPLGARGRNAGSSFSQFQQLTNTSNSERLVMSFAPNGDGFGTWGIATTGAPAQQTLRPAGQLFEAQSDMTPCGRFVDAAVSTDGRLAVACSFRLGVSPPDIFRTSILPGLARVNSSTNVISAVIDPFIRPRVAWGADGTTVAAGRHSLNTNPVPPSPEPGTITARVQGPTFTETSTVDASPNVSALAMSDLKVLADGTTLVAGAKDGGARVWVRDPGSVQSFVPVVLPGARAQSVAVDSGGFAHVLSQTEIEPREATVTIRSVGGLFGPNIPVPMTGPSAFVPQSGFQVAPDRTAYVLMREDDTIAVSRRRPSDIAFEQPVTIATDVTEGPETAMTPEGDLLVAWVEQLDPDTRRLMVGGWDENPPSIGAVQVPASGLVGGELTFSAQASDPMGIANIQWDFGDGQTAEGATVTHTYDRDGSFPVRLTVTDRAGNEAIQNRTIGITGQAGPGPPPRIQLRVNAPRRIAFRTLARRGLRIVARADRPFRVRAGIGPNPRRAANNPIGRRAVNALRARHVIVIRPRRALLGKPRNFRLNLHVEARTPDGRRAVLRRAVRVTRR